MDWEEHRGTINFVIALTAFLLAVFIFSAAQVYVESWQSRGDVVAEVNDEKIYENDVQTVMQEDDMERFEAVQRLIQQRLLAQEAEHRGITVTDEDVTERITELAQQRNTTVEGFIRAAERSGIAEDRLRERLRHSLISDRVLAQVTPNKMYDEDDLRAYYDANPEEFTTPKRHEVTLVSVRTAQAAAEARRDPCEYNCQALNVTERTGLAPAVITAAMNSSVGETVQVRVDDRYHVLRKEAEHPAETRPFEQVRAELRDALTTNQRRTAVQSYLRSLRRKADIENYAEDEAEAAINATEEAVFSCIQANATLYGARWDSQTREQIERFGDRKRYISYVECAGNDVVPRPVCERAGITAYPTWVIDGEHHLGVQSVERVAGLADCV